MTGSPKEIFVADDDGDILMVLRMMLQTEGYIVEATKNARRVFEYDSAHLPDLILLDIWMSGIDGREICYKLKENILTRHIPVLFISANANIREITSEYKADGFISKPFDMGSLLSKVRDNLLSVNTH